MYCSLTKEYPCFWFTVVYRDGAIGATGAALATPLLDKLTDSPTLHFSHPTSKELAASPSVLSVIASTILHNSCGLLLCNLLKPSKVAHT